MNCSLSERPFLLLQMRFIGFQNSPLHIGVISLWAQALGKKDGDE